jgi:flagellar protein FlaG
MDMAIESTNMPSIASLTALARELPATKPNAGTVVSSASAAATSSTVDPQALKSAAAQIQSYLSGHTDPPQFSVDYLSGLGVMTVRAAESGEVVFQIPDAQAVHLAQLIRNGSPPSVRGIMHEVI